MRARLIAAILLASVGGAALARPQTAPPAAAPAEAPFTYQKLMVQMRDGAKMETVILRPRGVPGKLPILFQRTPYGIPQAAPIFIPPSWKPLVADGYIFVFQSMRGRFGSDGKFTLSTGIKTTPNEATDAYDSIAWLVKHVPDNNGKVGMWGVSYHGFAAALSLDKPFLAL